MASLSREFLIALLALVPSALAACAYRDVIAACKSDRGSFGWTCESLGSDGHPSKWCLPGTIFDKALNGCAPAGGEQPAAPLNDLTQQKISARCSAARYAHRNVSRDVGISGIRQPGILVRLRGGRIPRCACKNAGGRIWGPPEHPLSI